MGNFVSRGWSTYIISLFLCILYSTSLVVELIDRAWLRVNIFLVAILLFWSFAKGNLSIQRLENVIETIAICLKMDLFYFLILCFLKG